MPWFKNKSDGTERELPQPIDQENDLNLPKPIVGKLKCKEHDCEADNAAQCQYVDRRQHQCDTAWCPLHQVIINDSCYCVRHANTLDAIGSKGNSTEGLTLPDVYNRVPNLVRWISKDVDENVRLILDRHRQSTQNQSHGSVHSIRSAHEQTTWESTWQIFDHTGIVMRVSIDVTESEPTIANVRVNNVIVMREIPPWLKHRALQQHVSHEVDLRERKAFNDLIIDSITQGIDNPNLLIK